MYIENQRQHKGKRDFPFETLLVFLWPKLFTNNRQNEKYSSPKQDGIFLCGGFDCKMCFCADKNKSCPKPRRLWEMKISQLNFQTLGIWKV